MNKKTIIIVYLLLFGITAQAQEAYRKYTEVMNQLENQTDTELKSTERGKALATFHSERKKEAGVEKAVSETAYLLIHFIDYDSYAAFNCLMKIETPEETKKLLAYLSPEGRSIVRTMAKDVTSNWKSNPNSYSTNVPQHGYGLKGAWKKNTITTNNNIAIQNQATKTDDGTTEYTKAITAYRAKNHTEALNWFNQSANKGHADAMFNIGAMYYNGESVAKNEIEAKKWYQKAADNGHKGAQSVLHLMKEQDKYAAQILSVDANGNTEFNKGLAAYDQKNYTSALNWFKQAAAKGEPSAAYNIGLMYHNGRGVAKNEAEAIIWFQKAANSGHEKAKTIINAQKFQAQANNGNEDLSKGYAAYQAKNYTETLNWYKQAADKGNMRAMYNIGLMYYKGEGVTLSYPEALSWFKKSGDKGFADAMYNVAIMYNNGFGTIKNDNEAYNWFKKSADAGNEKAKEKLKTLVQTPATTVKTVAAPPSPNKPIINKNVSWLGKNGLYGLTDRSGKIIVPPQYDNALGFNKNGIAIASKNKKKGLIDNNGKELTSFEYDSDLGEADGLFLLIKKNPLPNNSLNEETYLLNENGKTILSDADKPYKIKSPFYSGRAMVWTANGTGYIDKKGKLVIPDIYSSKSLLGSSEYWFKDGVAVIKRKENDQKIIIDINGKVLTQKDYFSIGGNTSLFVRKPWEGIFTYYILGGKSGYLDKSGKEITAAIYDNVFPFQQGHGKVSIGKNTFKQGFVDRTGKEIIPLIYDIVNDFSEGLAAVKLQGKWGFIDLMGNMIIPPQFENVGDFSEGLARAAITQKDRSIRSGFINKKGEWVISPQLNQTSGKFVEGLVGVNLNDLWGFINTKGELVIQPKYKKYGFSDFEDGIKSFEIENNQYIYVDKTGKEFKEN